MLKNKYWKILLAVILFLVSVLIFCSLTKPKIPTLSPKYRILDISLEIKAPFSISSLTIEEDGSVVYIANDSRFRKPETREQGKFTTDQMNQLFDLINSTKFFSLEDQPYNSQTDPTDGSTYTITVGRIPSDVDPTLVDMAVTKVSCYESNCQPEFRQIKAKILEFWGKEFLEVGV